MPMILTIFSICEHDSHSHDNEEPNQIEDNGEVDSKSKPAVTKLPTVIDDVFHESNVMYNNSWSGEQPW